MKRFPRIRLLGPLVSKQPGKHYAHLLATQSQDQVICYLHPSLTQSSATCTVLKFAKTHDLIFFLKQNRGELIELIHKKLDASKWSLSHPFAGYSPEQQGPCRPVAQDRQARGNLHLEAWQFYSGKKECFYNYYVKCSSVSRSGYEVRHSRLRYEENIPFPNRDLTWSKNIK